MDASTIKKPSISKRGLEAAIAILVLVILAAFLFPAMRMDFVPTAAQVKSHRHVAPFLVNPKGIQGVYGNFDIDTIVFRYTTTSPNAADFENQLFDRAAAAGWSSLPGDDKLWRFERITPKGNRLFSGAEEVRVRFNFELRRVDVAWVQGDSSNDVTSFSDTHEAEWAQSAVWPRIEKP